MICPVCENPLEDCGCCTAVERLTIGALGKVYGTWKERELYLWAVRRWGAAHAQDLWMAGRLFRTVW